MATPLGYADVSVWITIATSTRPSAITFGVDAGEQSVTEVFNDVVASLQVSSGIRIKLANTAAFSRVRVALGTDDDEDLVYDAAMNQPGSHVVEVAPPNCALLVHKRTARGGRRGRGRLFMPWFLNEAKVTSSGMIDASEQVSLQTPFNVWFADLATRGIPMVLLHQGGDTPPGPPNLVTSLAVDPMNSTQRRRLGR